MFLRIAGAQSAEQSGIKGVKRPFDPNIMTLVLIGLKLCIKTFPEGNMKIRCLWRPNINETVE